MQRGKLRSKIESRPSGLIPIRKSLPAWYVVKARLALAPASQAVKSRDPVTSSWGLSIRCSGDWAEAPSFLRPPSRRFMSRRSRRRQAAGMQDGDHSTRGVDEVGAVRLSRRVDWKG